MPSGFMHLTVVVGTRPEVIKLAPVIHALQELPHDFKVRVVSTGQHDELLHQACGFFQLQPDIDLGVMRPGQNLEALAAGCLQRAAAEFRGSKTDMVVVQGDTTTAFCAALAAYYCRVPVAHVEAGLRTGRRYEPFPEELNRRLISALAEIHFAPLPANRAALLAEGVPAEGIFVTGNTVVDAMAEVLRRQPEFENSLLKEIFSRGTRKVLVTCHRRENHGAPFDRIMAALEALAAKYSDVEILFPVHPNPEIKRAVYGRLASRPRVHLVEALSYPEFILAMERSHLILSDSGGVQEEAPAIGKPVLILRNATERREAVTCGAARLVGTDTEKIVSAAAVLLDDPAEYRRMTRAVSCFGDGRAAQRICGVLLWKAGHAPGPPAEFKPDAATP